MKYAVLICRDGFNQNFKEFLTEYDFIKWVKENGTGTYRAIRFENVVLDVKVTFK